MIARRVAIALAILAAILFPFIFGDQDYLMSEARFALIYGLVAVTLNLLIGYGGQISLGHAGLLAVGAYTTAILANDYSLPLPVLVLAAAIVTAVVGLALGLPTGRLRGHYLAIATLGFGLAVPQLALNLDRWTNGSEGLIVPPATLGGITFSSARTLYFLVLVVVLLSLLAILSLLHTSTGRRFMAIRDSEEAAMAMGINPWSTKVILFTTSAFFTGVAGALSAFQAGVVAPTTFPFALSLFFLAMVIVGGLASVWGSMAGALLLVYVQDKASGVSGLSTAIIGAVVVAILLVAPQGLAGVPRQIGQLVRRQRRHTSVEPVTSEARRGA